MISTNSWSIQKIVIGRRSRQLGAAHTSKHDARGEQAKADDRAKIENVSEIQNSAFECFKMIPSAQTSQQSDGPISETVFDEFCDRLKTAENEAKTNQQGHDKTDDLISSHRGRQLGDSQKRTREQSASNIRGEN